MYNEYFMLNWDKLPQKARHIKTEREYFNDTLNVLGGLFLWDIPKAIKGLPLGWLENTLARRGCIALGKIDSELVFAFGQYQGQPGIYGLPTEFLYTTVNGKSGIWKVDEDCVVLYNNMTIQPDIEHIARISSMLCNLDTSLDILVKYTRATPIPIAENDSHKKELEKALKDMREGKESIIKSLMLKGSEVLDLSNKNGDISNLQDLSVYKDELVKWLYMPFGIVVDNKDKKAQINTKEMDSFNQLAGVSLYNRYYCRDTFCKKANELFSTDFEGDKIAVHLNPLFNDNDVNDNGVEDDVEQESIIDNMIGGVDNEDKETN